MLSEIRRRTVLADVRAVVVRVDKQFFLSAPGALAVSILARNLGEDYAEVSDTRVVREINNIVGR